VYGISAIAEIFKSPELIIAAVIVVALNRLSVGHVGVRNVENLTVHFAFEIVIISRLTDDPALIVSPVRFPKLKPCFAV